MICRLQNRDEGAILVSVTWLVLLLSLIAVGILSSTLQTRKNSRSIRQDLQHQLLAVSAVETFLRSTFYDPEEQVYANGRVRVLGQEIDVYVTFESGKVDLNRANAELLSALFAATGSTHEEAIKNAAGIMDWRDADSHIHDQGAELLEYQLAGLSYGPRNGAFESVDEVRFVLGLSGKVTDCVKLYLTVYSSQSEVDLEAGGAVAAPIVQWAFDSHWQNYDWPNPKETGTRVKEDISGEVLTLQLNLMSEPILRYAATVRFKSLTDRSYEMIVAPVPTRNVADAACLVW